MTMVIEKHVQIIKTGVVIEGENLGELYLSYVYSTSPVILYRIIPVHPNQATEYKYRCGI